MKNATIKCPNCGQEIRMDETEYAAILQQVQTAEFDAQVDARVLEIQRHLVEKHNLEMEKGVNDALRESEKAHTEELETMRQQMQGLTNQIQQANTTIQTLNSQAQSSEQAKQLAVLQATSQLREQMDTQRIAYEERLANERAQSEAEKSKLLYSLEQQKEQTEFYRDLKSKMSTKMIGETLEQHCEVSFNQIRMTAFPNAEFGKDNDASSGSKGDYIFREKDPSSGSELLSIMFEMKNEMDTTATKHKNEDFFAELDKDRREKGCEYAVLVSMLEADSDFYNAGIVDVSYKYPKMFVVRPQNFLTIIGLLRNASLGALQYKQELALARAQHIDISEFEDRLLDFKGDFGANVEKAGKHFTDAITAIDKSIDQMQKTKNSLLASLKQLETANKKVEKVTVKKLTKGNPTVQALIEDARSSKGIITSDTSDEE